MRLYKHNVGCMVTIEYVDIGRVDGLLVSLDPVQVFEFADRGLTSPNKEQIVDIGPYVLLEAFNKMRHQRGGKSKK